MACRTACQLPWPAGYVWHVHGDGRRWLLFTKSICSCSKLSGQVSLANYGQSSVDNSAVQLNIAYAAAARAVDTLLSEGAAEILDSDA